MEREWPGAFNARDLGGLPVAGGRLREAALFRSGQPEAWTPEGWRAAAADGVRLVVDLRPAEEPRRAASGFAEAGIRVEHVPVEDPTNATFRANFVPYLNHPSGYAEFVTLFPDLVAGAVARVVAAGPGTLVCCSAGRDRTGLVTGLLLRGLGADLDTLRAADERATRAVNDRHRVRETPHPYESYAPEPAISEVVASRGDALAAFFGELDAAAWLRDRGVDLDAARAKFVEPLA